MQVNNLQAKKKHNSKKFVSCHLKTIIHFHLWLWEVKQQEEWKKIVLFSLSKSKQSVGFCAIKSSCETFLNQALLKTFQFDFHCFHGWLKVWIKTTNFISLSQNVNQLFWQCFRFSFYKIWAKPIGRLMRYLRNTSRTSTFSNQMQTDFRKISVTTSDASEVKNGKLFFWLLTFQS